jgi:hypothetical protein
MAGVVAVVIEWHQRKSLEEIDVFGHDWWRAGDGVERRLGSLGRERSSALLSSLFLWLGASSR